MLTQPSREPIISHDQPMHGRCFTCGAVVECRFSECKLIDDHPLGRVATVACPNNLNATVKCNTVVRMRQTRSAE